MHCIGVDVSKQELVTYDGKVGQVFPNDRGLSEFASFLKETGDTLIVFEPTSTYSRRLETLCRTEGISCCLLNPRVIPHLRQVGRGRRFRLDFQYSILYLSQRRGERRIRNDSTTLSTQASLRR